MGGSVGLGNYYSQGTAYITIQSKSPNVLVHMIPLPRTWVEKNVTVWLNSITLYTLQIATMHLSAHSGRRTGSAEKRIGPLTTSASSRLLQLAGHQGPPGNRLACRWSSTGRWQEGS